MSTARRVGRRHRRREPAATGGHSETGSWARPLNCGRASPEPVRRCRDDALACGDEFRALGTRSRNRSISSSSSRSRAGRAAKQHPTNAAAPSPSRPAPTRCATATSQSGTQTTSGRWMCEPYTNDTRGRRCPKTAPAASLWSCNRPASVDTWSPRRGGLRSYVRYGTGALSSDAKKVFASKLSMGSPTEATHSWMPDCFAYRLRTALEKIPEKSSFLRHRPVSRAAASATFQLGVKAQIAARTVTGGTT